MKIAILSDVHGNLPALEAVLVEVDALAPDGILVLGDLTGGPSCPETIALLRERGCIMIRGNNERYHLNYEKGLAPAGWYARKQFGLLRWNHRRFSPETLALFAALPEQRTAHFDGAGPIRMVHGSPRRDNEGLDPDLDPGALQTALALTAEPALACGHSHIPWQRRLDGKLVFNPGAVCGALNGDTRAQYALLEWHEDGWQVQHRAAPYDLATLRRDFAASGLLAEGNYIARAFLDSCLTGLNVSLYLLRHARRAADEAGIAAGDAFPDDLWDRAGESFPWERYEKEESSA